jgi:hypothetical protein
MTIGTRRLAVAGAWVAAGVLGAGALTGVAVAAEGASAPATGPTAASATTTDQRPAGAPATDRAGRLRRMGDRVLHGQLTIRTKDGGVRTVDTQLGAVTAVSSTALTVKSSDGFTMTWVLDGDTKVRKDRGPAKVSDLAVGETVRLAGPAAGDGATARLVVVRPAGAAGDAGGGGTSGA